MKTTSPRTDLQESVVSEELTSLVEIVHVRKAISGDMRTLVHGRKALMVPTVRPQLLYLLK